jgi:hypothetical protein
MLRALYTLYIILVLMTPAFSQKYYTNQDSLRATRIDEQILIDGMLAEASWQRTESISNFAQREPLENAAPSQKTEVYVLYDEQALYIGARMYDSRPDSIMARLGRRDSEDESDLFAVFIDPYLDRRSGYIFIISPASSLMDGVMLNDGWEDYSWDGVWAGKAKIDQEGWTTELRIPYSQLRFQKKDVYAWGINFGRRTKRKNEDDFLVFTPKNGSGFASRFPILAGISNVNPPANVEILPYVRAKAEYLNVEAANPFNDGSRYIPAVGTDLKIGLSSNLTLDCTINPDFGQVEVDPAVVNLSDVETTFEEKRPFFLEGASIFDFGRGGATNYWTFNWSNPDFFYTRRIGRTPQGSLPDIDEDSDYVDLPEGTRIIGAAKLTGKVGNNWNFGTVQALTSREYADISIKGNQFKSEIEPLTYYGIVRAQKEIQKGFRGIGLISTLSNRFFKEAGLEDEINKSALTCGADGWTFLDTARTWVVTSWLGLSHIRGNEQRLIDLQENSVHYFQRPDARNFKVDSSATSLTGYAARFTINKQKGNVLFNSAIGFISPKFDVNDMGYQGRSDIINAHLGGGYKWTKPTSFYRDVSLITALFGNTDFDYNITWAGIFSVADITFSNYYFTELVFAYNPETINTRRTRGGPLTINPAAWEADFFLRSDDRKPWVFEISYYMYTRWAEDNQRQLRMEFEWKPLSNVLLAFDPSIMWNKAYTQWIDVFSDPYAATYAHRYVFGTMHQTEFAAGLRVNWTFTPHLSFQLYLQPLVSAGDFSDFKELARAKSYDFNHFGQNGSTINLNDDTYLVDPDGTGPASAFEFSDPDFNYNSLRANAVLRWEYLPGSTFYLVWTQSRSYETEIGQFRFEQSLDDLRHVNPDNIFMVKLNYWLNW